MAISVEEIKNKIKSTGQGMVNKTKQLAELSRLSLKLDEEEEQLEALYANLGRAFYQVTDGEPELIYQDLFRAVDGSLKNIAYFHKHINELKGLRYCNYCGDAVDETAVYCASCGKLLSALAPTQEEAYKVCTHCGTVCTDGEDACPKCQKALL